MRINEPILSYAKQLTLLTILGSSAITSAAGLNFDMGNTNEEGTIGFSIDIDRTQDDGNVGLPNASDYDIPEPSNNMGDQDSIPVGSDIGGYQAPNPYPANNYTPTTPSTPVGPSNIFSPPTAESCAASVINYARPYVESYQAAPSLNSKCGFQQLMEFNFFDSLTMSGLIDGAFCGFARQIVNPLIETANKHISNINSYIPSHAELSASGQWVLNEDGALELGANLSIFGTDAVSAFWNSSPSTIDYNYQPGQVGAATNINQDLEELIDIVNTISDTDVSVPGNQNTVDEGTDYEFDDVFQNLPTTGPENTGNSNTENGVTVGEPSGVNGIAVGEPNGGNQGYGNSSNEIVDENGTIDWGDNVFQEFFGD